MVAFKHFVQINATSFPNFAIPCGGFCNPFGNSSSEFAVACCNYYFFLHNEFSSIKTSWASAESVCGYLGGHLVSIQSDTENDYVARLILTWHSARFTFGAYVSGGTWKWTDYTAGFAYSNFKGLL
ncbi:hypothetical protein COOONC_25545 [Cooperia oncophora]